jgi:hypothetical protein
MIGFVINLTYNLTNPFLMLIIELMQYITIYSKGPFADEVWLGEDAESLPIVCWPCGSTDHVSLRESELTKSMFVGGDCKNDVIV